MLGTIWYQNVGNFRIAIRWFEVTSVHEPTKRVRVRQRNERRDVVDGIVYSSPASDGYMTPEGRLLPVIINPFTELPEIGDTTTVPLLQWDGNPIQTNDKVDVK